MSPCYVTFYHTIVHFNDIFTITTLANRMKKAEIGEKALLHQKQPHIDGLYQAPSVNIG